MRLFRPGLAVFILVVCSAVALSKDKVAKTYPERGTVLAMHTAETSFTTGVSTDQNGKTSGGESYRRIRPVYRIEREKMFYELEGLKREQSLQIGQSVDFRIEKDKAYVQRGAKEQKFRVVGVESKPSR